MYIMKKRDYEFESEQEVYEMEEKGGICVAIV